MSMYQGKHSEYRDSQDVDGGQGMPSGKKKKHRSRLTRPQKALVALFVVLVVAVGLAAAYKGLFVKPELPGLTDGNTEVTADGMAPKVSGERKSDDYYTILLLGRDTGGGGNCDTMMLVSYDVTNQKMTVMSIPRDTMVNVPWDVKKINSVYNYYGGGDKGIAKLDNEISDLIGFVPDYSVIVEWEAVGKLVDAIGGVTYDVPRDMDYEDPYQDLSIHIKKGTQTLTGEQAMGVVRFRDGKNGYNNGDLGRIETQQGFMKAVIQQLLQIKNVTKIQKFAQIFQENVTTDLSVQNLFWFGKSAIMGGLTMDNVTFVTMPNETTTCWSRTYHNYQSYVVPDAEALMNLVNTSLSPYKEQVTLSELDIMSVNKDGSVSSTTGNVEDSKAASRPSVPSGTSTKPVDNEPTGSTGKEEGSGSAGSGSSTGTTGGTASGGSGETTGGTTGETTGGTTGTTGTTGGTTGETTGGSSETTGGTTGETGTGTTGGTTGGTDGTAGDTTGGTGTGNTGAATGDTTGEEGYGNADPTGAAANAAA